MAGNSSPLEEIHIASPCGAAWEEMEGGDRVRLCRHCEKNVYNLSDMNRREAEELVREMEGRLCVRFYRRRDGTVLTDNCPVGFRAARRWVLVHVAGIAATLGGLFGLRLTPEPPLATMGFAVWTAPAPPTADPDDFQHDLERYAAVPSMELGGRPAEYTLNGEPWPKDRTPAAALRAGAKVQRRTADK